MAYYPELEDMTLDELVACFHGLPTEADDDTFVYFSEVALQLRRKGKAGNSILWQEFDHSSLDEEHLRAVICALTFPDEYPGLTPLEDSMKTALHKKLPVLLRDHRPLIQAEVIDGLESLGDKSMVEAVLELYKSPSPYVRGAVLRYMARLHSAIAKKYLLESLKDSHYVVRLNAIDELDWIDAVEAIPHIRELLTDEDPDVREAAETAIKNLTDRLED